MQGKRLSTYSESVNVNILSKEKSIDSPKLVCSCKSVDIKTEAPPKASQSPKSPIVISIEASLSIEDVNVAPLTKIDKERAIKSASPRRNRIDEKKFHSKEVLMDLKPDLSEKHTNDAQRVTHNLAENYDTITKTLSTTPIKTKLEVKVSTDKKLKSPRRDIHTRNASTSPKCVKGQQTDTLADLKLCSIESSTSTGAKPLKLLRSTRSLSPRPPIKHQQAVTVSDEYDQLSAVTLHTKDKAHSAKTSPNLSHWISKSIENRSTICLIDPWQRMDGQPSSAPANSKTDNNDPWIWRSDLCTSSEKLNKTKSVDREPPRLKHCKSSSALRSSDQYDASPTKTSSVKVLSHNKVCMRNSVQSPHRHLNTTTTLSSTLLNPNNLVQARHSFSAIANPINDELQLNIRRLSEQCPPSTIAKQNRNSTEFTNHLHQFKSNASSVVDAGKHKISVEKPPEVILSNPVLETTC